MTISQPEDYDPRPPSVWFKTKIYHPNVDKHGKLQISSTHFLTRFTTGNICFEILDCWNDKRKLSEIIYGVRKLLLKPDEAYASEDSRAYNAFMSDEKHFKKRAVDWTSKFAMDPEWPDEDDGLDIKEQME